MSQGCLLLSRSDGGQAFDSAAAASPVVQEYEVACSFQRCTACTANQEQDAQGQPEAATPKRPVKWLCRILAVTGHSVQQHAGRLHTCLCRIVDTTELPHSAGTMKVHTTQTAYTKSTWPKK